MEHNKVSALMAGWYKMFGGKLEIHRQSVDEGIEEMLSCVAAQTDGAVSGDQNQKTEEKEEAEEKSCCVGQVSLVPEPPLLEQTSSWTAEQRDDSNGQDLRLGLSQ